MEKAATTCGKRRAGDEGQEKRSKKDGGWGNYMGGGSLE